MTLRSGLSMASTAVGFTPRSRSGWVSGRFLVGITTCVVVPPCELGFVVVTTLAGSVGSTPP